MASLIKRKKFYHIQYCVGGKAKRKSLNTTSLQVAREKLRQFESAQANGIDNPLPSKTPLADIVTKYVNYIRTHKTPKSAQTDIYYLREMFGAICDAITITSRTPSLKMKRKPPKPGQDRRHKEHVIEASYLEQITTGDIVECIQAKVRSRGLAPKTANRYREIMTRLFNWATKQCNVKMPGGVNPAAAVERYKIKEGRISFLTMPQIIEQLNALEDERLLQTMVAVYIYAGLRREEALWLQREDIDLKAGRFGMIRIRAKAVGSESWHPKTGKARAIPISSTLRAYLDRYTPQLSQGGYYFPSPKGKRFDPDNFSRQLRAAQKKARLSWSCLDYRHTFGSQLAQKGESLYKISALMGNSPEICRRHYAALIPEALGDCVEFETDNQTLRLSAS